MGLGRGRGRGRKQEAMDIVKVVKGIEGPSFSANQLLLFSGSFGAFCI